ncbi:hypothetical protein FKO01_35615 [Mesorhizobium sp. B2-3-3]|uniref:hypothetical protein n=1 Tax=Mesorhizobium sp. B2-3-5 TaxID=2589958 RepID=UPI001126AD08|nr:hypothetical protein [Mesorhizobium sp. B2-3-5]TPM30638.1 hypothetical protein FJ958_13065 [Mesorhizobium sp. B2-3-5]TPN18632.1 hypothetical protein FKO01_35615 [Mesorhizobium sp. B2-3-3]
MGVSVDNENIILIPGMPTFRKSLVPPLSIKLPLVVHCRRGMYIFKGLFCSFCTLLMLAPALAFILGDPDGGRTLFEKMALFGILLYALSYAPFLSIAAAFSFWDAGLRKPALIIDRHGLLDNRSGLSVKWADVLSAKPIMGRTGYWGVSLRMREPALLPRSIRLGYPLLWRRKAGEAHIQCSFLTAPEHQLANSILTLVHRSGGQLLPAHPVFWSSVPAVVPQEKSHKE